MVWDLFKRHRAAVIAVLVVVVVLVRVGFLTLFGGLGYEYALACGLLVPGVAAVWTARAVATEPGERLPIDALIGGLLRGAALAGVAIAIGLMHGVRAGICDLGGGFTAFVLGPGIGALVGGTWGAIAGEVARSRKKFPRTIATLIALAGPIGGAAISVWRFYSSPMIFAYDPFVGYFSGTLYDTIVEPGTPLLTYRAGSIAFIASMLCFASILRRAASGSLRLEMERTRSFWVRSAFAVALFTGNIAEIGFGSRLGHWSTSATIARELGGTRHGNRCDVVFPSSLREGEAALLVKDCDEEIAEVEGTLGIRGPERITAFFFRDAQEKRRLMGAADTYIAKPWREEVYLQTSTYPHPVLGHEITHVIAGAFGRGPFRIAGSLGGWFPNPGLIEGVAVATSPDEDELTDLEWAAAMKKRNALPPMQAIFSVGFLGQSASKSYTLAGAFVRWVMTVKGAAAVRSWYAGKQSIEEIFGKSFSAIDAEYRAMLDAIILPPSAEAYVASKFERGSVFARKCPHEVDALKKGADTCRENHQLTRALELYDEALALDATEYGVRLARGVMAMRYVEALDVAAAGRAEVRKLATDEKAPLAVRHKARDALADDALASESFDVAATEYEALAAETPDEDAARTLEVKAIAARDPMARLAVTTLLVSAPGRRPPDPALAAAMIGEWEGKTGNVLAAYLLAKSEVNHGYFAQAAERFDLILENPVALTTRIHREALRQRAICACALSDASSVERLKNLADAPDGIYAGSAGGRRDGVLRLLRRCH